MSPEEIIAAELERSWAPLENLPTIAEDEAEMLLAALREAGYRVVKQTNITAVKEDGVPLRRVWSDDLEDQ